MNGEQRRQEIIVLLKTTTDPVSGSDMAQVFGVSRQIIVQDIALLKVAGHKIYSTYKGYLLNEGSETRRVLLVRHSLDQIAEELYTIVDQGGRVLDVFVKHDIYGELRAVLAISTRKQADDFIAQLAAGKISPLMHLTDDWHYHTVDADSEEILDQIVRALSQKGFLTETDHNPSAFC